MTSPIEAENLTEVSDFSAILSTSVDGVLPLLVGGHAVSLWALTYKDRLGRELEEFMPLLSKDLDVFGSARLLDELERIFGGSKFLSGARSPVIGQLHVELGGTVRKIEILRDVRGLTTKEMIDGAVPLVLEGVEVSVLSPIVQLRAKVANVATIDQTGRNDLRHVKIMLLVVREYLSDLVRLEEAGELNPRAVITALELTLEIVRSRSAEECMSAGAGDFSQVWPLQLLKDSRSSRIQNFLKHRLPA